MNARDYSLDAARGLLMILGVFLHAANIYAPGSSWLVVDADSDSFFALSIDLIHSFRMPAFFWIAGYFTALALGQKDGKSLWSTRLKRIVVPLMSSWFLLNTLQEHLGFLASNFDSVTPGIYHLWFLFDLLIFTILGFFIMRSGEMLIFLQSPLWYPRNNFLMVCGFVIFAWLCSVTARATPWAYSEFLGISSLYRLATYFPWFFLGMFMHFHRNLYVLFCSIPWFIFPLGCFFIAFISPLTRLDSYLLRAVFLILQISSTFLCLGSLLGICRRLFNEPNSIIKSLSEASYTIYLVHHVLVLYFGSVLLSYDFNVFLKYIIVVFCSLFISFSLHHLVINRVGFLAFLFNGRS